MILKRIIIRNIRSYVGPTSIDLPMGTILFQGDVGCGKSSILSSIEFALFGLGDLDGCYLLRNGENKGSVQLDFEVSSKLYTVFRSLIKKSKNVVQDQGYVIEDGEKTDYSVSELKARILEIINIKERIQTRTTSIIYRFAIFTPQEMMKQVLTENQDRRLEILRRAFGIEEYSTVKKNITEIGIPWLRAETRSAKELSADLLEKKSNLDKQRERIERISKEIMKASGLLVELEGRISKLQTDLKKLQVRKEEVVRLEESIPLLQNKLLTNQKLKSDTKEDLTQLEKDLEKIKDAENNVAIVKPKFDDYSKKRLVLKDLEEPVSLFSKLEKEKIRLENTIEQEKEHLHQEIRRLQIEIKENKEEIRLKENSIKILDELKRQKGLLQEKIKLLPQVRKQLQVLSNKISTLDANKRSLMEETEKKSMEMNQINKMGEGVPCPKCKQKLTKEHILTVMGDFEEEKNQINKAVKELGESLRLAIANRKKFDDEITSLEETDEELRKISNRIAELDERKKGINNLALKLEAKERIFEQQTTKFNGREYCEIEKKRLADLKQEMNRLSKRLEGYDAIKEAVAQYEVDGIELKYVENTQIVKRKPMVEKNIVKVSKSIQKLESSIRDDTKELRMKGMLLEKNREVTDKITKLEAEKKDIEEEHVNCNIEIASKQAELGLINIHDLGSEVSKKEVYFRNMLVYGQAHNWMNECFVPIVEDIEQHVLASINEEFNVMFQHWFNLLVEMGDITVEVDETFTPLITHGGYALDVSSLSGGEKTSVALAYRLALNAMVKKTASFQSHLLILDEPTDGFSREQLIRLRYVLDELDSSQIIMVSHERELESFVSTIYRITKENGISKVEVVAH